MNFLDQLRKKTQETNSIVCMGMDPVLERIPIEGNPEKVITKFYLDILDALISENIKPAIVKPNIAFYEQYGFKGLRALKKLIDAYKKQGIPVLLDAKRGDIGKTSRAYAKTVFEFWNVDAVTISPYMGSDSIGPFLEYCRKCKGVYILVRTSNKGAADIQDLEVNEMPMYMKIAERLIEWFTPGIAAVVGATCPDELEKISKFFVSSKKQIPMLIPGVGAQGGTAQEVIKILKKSKNEFTIHRINSSSGINYAYEKENTDDYAGAAVRAIKKLNKEIGYNY